MKERELVEPTMGEDMSTAEGRVFKKDPMINVISKEDFEDRIEKVFHILWKTLAKSFGPYGAPTMIYNYPWSHVTKDGFTIMKNLSMDVSETIVDQAIANMASDICGRLNYSVGDGTTSAVIATNSIYRKYMSIRESLKQKFVLPRDICCKLQLPCRSYHLAGERLFCQFFRVLHRKVCNQANRTSERLNFPFQLRSLFYFRKVPVPIQ